MIYADHAATTKTSRAAKEAMIACMEEHWGNPSSLYTLGRKPTNCCKCPGTHRPDALAPPRWEIYFTSGGQ